MRHPTTAIGCLLALLVGDALYAQADKPTDPPAKKPLTVEEVIPLLRSEGSTALQRVAETEAGLTHFEGRQSVGLMRHLMRTLIVLGFVAVHTEWMRGGKTRG